MNPSSQSPRHNHKLVFATASTALFLFAAGVQAETISLADTWQEFDPLELQTLSNQSASGFTATVLTNSSGEGNVVVPRVFQTFSDIPFTNNGDRVQVTFDLVVHDPMVVGDTQFRFGLANTNYNELMMIMYDIGTPAGTAIRSRGDINTADADFGGRVGITDDPAFRAIVNGFENVALHVPSNWNSSFNTGFNLDGGAIGASGNLVPNGVGIGVAGSLATKHHFRYSLERTPTAMVQDAIWSNDAGPVVSGVSGSYLDTTLSIYEPKIWQSINAFGFHVFNNAAFGEAGSYTISNLKITTGFSITSVSRDGSGDVVLTWESSPLDSSFGAEYVVERATSLITPVWTPIATNTAISTRTEGYWTSYTNSASADDAAFYRVLKRYPSAQ